MPFVIEDDDVIPRNDEVFIVAIYSKNPSQSSIVTYLDLKSAKNRFNEWSTLIGVDYPELVLYRSSFIEPDNHSNNELNTYAVCSFTSVRTLWHSDLTIANPHSHHPKIRIVAKSDGPLTTANAIHTAGVAFDFQPTATTQATFLGTDDAAAWLQEIELQQAAVEPTFNAHAWLDIALIEDADEDFQLAYTNLNEALVHLAEDAYYFFTQDIGMDDQAAFSEMQTYLGSVVAYWTYQAANNPNAPFDPHHPVPTNDYFKFSTLLVPTGFHPGDCAWEEIETPDWWDYFIDSLPETIRVNAEISWNNSAHVGGVGPGEDIAFFDLEGDSYFSWFGGPLMMFSAGPNHMVFVHKFVDSSSFFILNDADTDEIVYNVCEYDFIAKTFTEHVDLQTESEVYNIIQGLKNVATPA